MSNILGKRINWHISEVLSLAFSPDKKTLISGSDDKILKIWRLDSTAQPYMLSGSSTNILSVVISPDGLLFAAGGLEPHLRVRTIDDGKLIHSIKCNSAMRTVVFSPKGEVLTAGGFDSWGGAQRVTSSHAVSRPAGAMVQFQQTGIN